MTTIPPPFFQSHFFPAVSFCPYMPVSSLSSGKTGLRGEDRWRANETTVEEEELRESGGGGGNSSSFEVLFVRWEHMDGGKKR